MAAPSMNTIVERLAVFECPYAEAQYRTRRDVTGIRITVERMAERAGVPVATDADIDAALDEEA